MPRRLRDDTIEHASSAHLAAALTEQVDSPNFMQAYRQGAIRISCLTVLYSRGVGKAPKGVKPYKFRFSDENETFTVNGLPFYKARRIARMVARCLQKRYVILIP